MTGFAVRMLCAAAAACASPAAGGAEVTGPLARARPPAAAAAAPAQPEAQAAAPAARAAPEAVAVPEAGARGPVTSLPLPRYVSMRAETANARRGPSLSQRVDWTFLRRGLPLEVTAEYGQWRRVRDADGAGGWVHHSLLSGIRTVLVRGAGPVALRAGASEGAAIRAFAEPGVVARLEDCAAGWCLVGADGVKGWTPEAALWGVGGP